MVNHLQQEQGHQERHEQECVVDTDSNNNNTSKSTAAAPAIPLDVQLAWIDRLRARWSDGGAAEGCGALLPDPTADAARKNAIAASASGRNGIDDNPGASPPPPPCSGSTSHAPKGMEGPFEQLYNALKPCLLVDGGGGDDGEARRRVHRQKHQQNACVFIQGPRGSGKSLLLRQCLKSIVQQNQESSSERHQEEDEHRRHPSQNETNTAAPSSSSEATGSRRNKKKRKNAFFRTVFLPASLLVRDVQEVLRDISRQLLVLPKSPDDCGGLTPTTRTARANAANADAKAGDEAGDGHGAVDADGDNSDSDNQDVEAPRKKRRRWATQDLFHTQLLNDVLNLASVDGIPILFVLDDLDVLVANAALSSSSSSGAAAAGVGGGNSHLLLYHLLDRVAGGTSYMAVVGLTSHQGVMNSLEKRIASRAQGTAVFVQLGATPAPAGPGGGSGATPTWDSLVEAVLDLFLPPPTPPSGAARDQRERVFHQSLFEGIARILRRPTTSSSSSSNFLSSSSSNGASDVAAEQAYALLRRQHSLGKTMRWFSRVMYTALSLYREDVRRDHKRRKRQQRCAGGPVGFKASVPLLALEARYILEALACLGVAISIPEREPAAIGAGSRRTSAASNPLDPHLKALRDLSGPQVVLVLASRRILAREGQRSSSTANSSSGGGTPVPLTFDRLLQEYRLFNRGQGLMYCVSTLQRAFLELLQQAILRPASDHTGGGPWQYSYQQHAGTSVVEDWKTLGRIPLHLTVDIHRHVLPALERGLLDASTALVEWGKKNH